MNIFKTLLLILFLLITAGLVMTKPTIHKAAIIENSDFTLASLYAPEITVKSDFTEPLPPAQKQIVKRDVPVTQTFIPVQQQNVKVVSKPQRVISPPVKVQTVTQPKTELPKVVEKILKEQEHTQVVPKPQLKEPQEKPVVLQPQEPPKVVAKPVNTTPLTEKEEIIAWNKWRSDLQNKVMRDSKLSAPVGTTFHFSCTVDKFGNISNINTWSENDYYTPLAKRVIKPVLSSYQNQAILKFPDRTRRTITNVTGSFTMAYSDRYSTPADYSDYERIK